MEQAFSCVNDAGGSGSTIYLNDLGDVSLGAPASGEVLQWDGSDWVNSAEDDPNVETFAKTTLPNCPLGFVLKGNGTSLSCVADAGGSGDQLAVADLSDVSVTGIADGEFLVYDASTTTWLPGTEQDPNIQAFARNANPLPTCGVDEVLKADGTSLSCVNDAGSGSSAIALNALSDVTLTGPVANEILAFDGTGWVNQVETDPGVETFAKNTLPTCGVNQVLKGNGTSLSCVNDAGSSASAIAFGDLSDVDTTGAANGKIIKHDGTNWKVADEDVQAFAKTANALVNCSAGEVLTADGTSITCTPDTAGSTSSLGDLTDVSNTAPTDTQSAYI